MHWDQNRGPGPPHGQQPYQSAYTGLGYFSSTSQGQPSGKPPKRPRRWLLVLGALGAVILLGGAITTVVLVTRPGTPQAAPPSSSAPSSTSLPPPPMPTPMPTTVGQVRTPAVVPGWQGVRNPREETAYDIPAGWKVDKPGVVRGFQTDDGSKKVIVHATSVYKENYCADETNSNRGFVGWYLVGRSADPDTAARNMSHNLAAVAAGKDNTVAEVSDGKVTDTRVHGGRPARIAVSTATRLDQEKCPSPRRKAVAVTFRAAVGQVLFLMLFDDGVKDAPSQRTIDTIVSSLRDSP